MAGPITWRTIMGPDPSAAVRPMAIASHTINNAFDSLKGALTDYQTGVKDENTNAYLAALDRYATPEALQSAMQSGELNQLLGSMGPVHQDQVRAAAGDRLTQLLSHADGMRTYDRNQRSDAQEGEVAQLQLLASLGDQNALQRLAEMDLVNGQQIVQDAVTGYRGYRQDQRAANQDTRASEAHQLDQQLGELRVTRERGELDETEKLNQAADYVGRTFGVWRGLEQAGHLTPEQTSQNVMELKNFLVSDRGLTTQQANKVIDESLSELTYGRGGFGTERLINESREANRQERISANPFSQDTDKPGEVLEKVTSYAKNLKTSKDSDLSEEDYNTIISTVGQLVSERPYVIGSNEDGKPIHQRFTDSVLKMAVAEARSQGFFGNSLAEEIRRIAHRIMMDSETQKAFIELEDLKRGAPNTLTYRDLVSNQ